MVMSDPGNSTDSNTLLRIPQEKYAGCPTKSHKLKQRQTLTKHLLCQELLQILHVVNSFNFIHIYEEGIIAYFISKIEKWKQREY